MSHTLWEPADVRLAVYDRQGGLCGLCWEPMGSRDTGHWEAHHRLKRRNMPRMAQWCPCDLVALHARCHTQGPAAVHDHPEDARRVGLILLANEDPREVPVHVEWPWVGAAYLDCESMVVTTL